MHASTHTPHTLQSKRAREQESKSWHFHSNSVHLKSPVRKLSTINGFIFLRAHTQVAELTVKPVFNQHLMVSLSDDPVVLFEVWDTYIATYISV